MANKQRLDKIIQERYPHLSRTYIQSLIVQGKVIVNGQPMTKAGMLVDNEVGIELNVQESKYVSRAGFKLEKALQHFGIDVTDLTIMDAGLSTGGFADCLLQAGAKKIYGVDVGYGQVHEKIRNDPRVVCMERTNLRYLPPLPEPVDMVTLDLSFISIRTVLDVVSNLLTTGGKLVALIKPQFEAGRQLVGKGGIVTDPAVHRSVVAQVTAAIEEHGFVCQGVIESPILGTSGNKEFLVYCVKK